MSAATSSALAVPSATAGWGRITAPRWLPAFATAIPAFGWLCLFFLIPSSLVAVFSFGQTDLFGATSVDLSQPSLDRYSEAASETFRVLFVNTIQLAVVGTALCLLVAFPVAYLITTRLSGALKYALLAAVIVPFWMPFLLRTYSWRILLGDGGPLVGWLAPGASLGMIDSLAGAQLGVVYNYLPLAVLPIAVALDRLDPSLRHAGRDLGASPLRVLWQVTLPAARPGLVAAGLLVFIPLIGDYVTPAILGGVKVAVVGSLISESFLGTQDWALGSAAAVLLIVLVLTVLALVWLLASVLGRLLGRVRPLDLLARLPRPAWLPSTTTDVWGAALRLFGGAVAVFLWGPIVTVICYSFNRGNTLPIWEGPGLRWYQAILANDALRASAAVSVIVAVLSTLIASVIGSLAGYALARAPRAIRRTLSALLLVVFVTPEVVTGIGLLLLYLSAGPTLADGTVRLVIAHSVISLALVAFVVQARLAGIDPALEDAAADLGAAPWRAIRQVTLPILLPGILAAAVLASTTSLDDVVTSSLVSSVGSTTLPVYIYSSLRNGLRGDAAAAGSLLMLATGLAVAVIGWVLRRRGQGSVFVDGIVGR